jgi:peptide/nickel transport system permease protein
MMQDKTVAMPVGAVPEPARPRTVTPTLASLTVKPVRHSRWRTLSATHWVLLGILTAFVLAAVFAEWVAPHDPELNNLRLRLTPPAWAEDGSSDHLLGTD